MASQTQIIIDEGIKEVSPEKPYGARHQSTLNIMFPDSPMYAGDLTTVERTETYQHLLDGDVTLAFDSGGSTVPGSPGLGFDTFNTDFMANGVPDVESNTETSDGKKFGDGEGAPTTPYVPPLTSPGVGSVEASDQPPFDFTLGTLPEEGNEFGSGYGATANPSITSAEIENQTLSMLGSYISGRSFLNSDSTG